VDPTSKKPTTSYGPSNLITLKEDMSTKDTPSTDKVVETGVTEKN
jgi:hypothetical protein